MKDREGSEFKYHIPALILLLSIIPFTLCISGIFIDGKNIAILHSVNLYSDCIHTVLGHLKGYVASLLVMTHTKSVLVLSQWPGTNHIGFLRLGFIIIYRRGGKDVGK